MPLTKPSSVLHAVVAVRVVNRLGGFGMSFLGLRLARDLGMSLSAVGLVLAVFGACTIPSRILGGVLATRVGARWTIIGGLLACAAALLAIGLGESVPVVVGAVLALGLAYELVEPATQAVIAETIDATRQASAFALLWSTLSVAGVLSGLIAAVLGRWGVSAIFVCDAVSSALAAVAAFLLLPSARAQRHPSPWRAALTRRLLVWTGVGTAYATLVMVIVFMLPLAVDLAGHSTSTTGWLLAVAAAAAIAAQRVLARVETRMPPARLLVIGHLVLAAGLGLWATGHIAGLVAGAVLEGASGAFLLGTYQATAARMGGPGLGAAVMTVFGLSWGVATVAAPFIGAPLLDIGPTTLWAACAAASLVLAGGHLARARARAPHALRLRGWSGS
ncbi:putative MFS family arabinose efflux permease [Knoellia remsis]|uniref:Putative MFS family arabinose efflux permease n=1 Tax=Knoellia remsis TaxID=407159 RepID=A0A2T0ULQ0_9MICO|nr:MFS transporter [Knoellia remsis]PRY58778.1 putative MFS family arabinose efflux permease [Knoellia remsis]